MNAKKLGIGAGLAGAGVVAARSFGPKLHEHCQSMCGGAAVDAAGKCGRAHESVEPEEPAERACCPQAASDATEVV